ncbi:hypothetical protein [Natrinema sp. DC36]|uniref:hypothetical protein n=1 Tax=Natrinema sp. DC36 TaxID=2878680 RepID=UPI001CF0A3ED|nr:hypothetical protein [Natrinema sp. DC36]
MTDDENYEISDEPPRDEDGHPVHPEKEHRICGATKSDRTTPTSHGRERDEYDYCLLAAGWGEDRSVGPCQKHPVTGEQWGESNPNFKAGQTSEYFKSKLSPRQRDVYDEVVTALDDDEDADTILTHFATRLMMLGEHSSDAALYKAGLETLSKFNIVENPDEINMNHSGEVEAELTVPDHVADAIATAAESNLEGGGES